VIARSSNTVRFADLELAEMRQRREVVRIARPRVTRA
jgi:hypothetical protein